MSTDEIYDRLIHDMRKLKHKAKEAEQKLISSNLTEIISEVKDLVALIEVSVFLCLQLRYCMFSLSGHQK